ncbi:transcriptional regulator, LysR family, partial [Candidatus Thiomargarita nelsonii]
PQMVLDVYSSPGNHFALLEAGEVHFVFSPYQPSANSSQLRSLKLVSLDFVILMSANNPLAKGELTMKKYIAASHGLISLTGRGGGMMEQHLIAQGHLAHGARLHVPLRLGSFSSVARFCERSDVLFHLPRRFAEELAQGRNLVVRDALPGMEMEHVNVFLYWHERYHKDAMCTWIREQLKAI